MTTSSSLIIISQRHPRISILNQIRANQRQVSSYRVRTLMNLMRVARLHHNNTKVLISSRIDRRHTPNHRRVRITTPIARQRVRLLFAPRHKRRHKRHIIVKSETVMNIVRRNPHTIIIGRTQAMVPRPSQIDQHNSRTRPNRIHTNVNRHNHHTNPLTNTKCSSMRPYINNRNHSHSNRLNRRHILSTPTSRRTIILLMLNLHTSQPQ